MGKNKQNSEHVKIYDKHMYVSQEKIKSVILIICVFIIGFVTGYFSGNTINNSSEAENSVNASYSQEN